MMLPFFFKLNPNGLLSTVQYQRNSSALMTLLMKQLFFLTSVIKIEENLYAITILVCIKPI